MTDAIKLEKRGREWHVAVLTANGWDTAYLGDACGAKNVSESLENFERAIAARARERCADELDAMADGYYDTAGAEYDAGCTDSGDALIAKGDAVKLCSVALRSRKDGGE